MRFQSTSQISILKNDFQLDYAVLQMGQNSIITKKICLLGNFSVGKTSMIARFVRHTFSEKYLTTVGVKIDSKPIELADGLTLKLIVWDIAGSDKYSGIDTTYITGSAGILFVVDGMRKETLDAIVGLRRCVNESVGDCAMVCAINKSDLKIKWEITRADIDGLIESGIPTFKTSAKTGENVEAAFASLAKLLIET